MKKFLNWVRRVLLIEILISVFGFENNKLKIRLRVKEVDLGFLLYNLIFCTVI